MLIGNKKVSQLLNLTPAEVQSNDLFLIIDSSTKESKNIDASQLASWLNASGSIYAIHSISADTASYILGVNVVGPVALATLAATAISSSWADRSGYADTSNSSSNTITASFALNASGLSITSSYLQYSGFPNGTSSYALSAGSAENVYTAAYLLYFGGDNGTASYSIVALSTSFCDTANTASYFNNVSGTVGSASYAISASTAATCPLAETASYLQFSGTDNGTASYAIMARGIAAGTLLNYGMSEPHAQSVSSSIIEDLIIMPSDGDPKASLIQAFGTVILNFTSSVRNEYSLSLSRLNRLSGEYVIMDREIIALNTTPIMNMWGSEATGSLKIPFTLIAQDNLIGEYLVEVSSSSPNLQLDTRLVRFTLSSTSDYADLVEAPPMIFDIQPSSSVLITFSSSLVPGAIYDYLPGLLNTGSENITYIDISSQGANSVQYIWKCNSLRYFNCEDNPIAELKYHFPPSLEALICDNCIINRIVDLDNTTASYIDISYNGITNLPLLSPSTSYLNISFNPIPSLPVVLPTTLTFLNAAGTFINGTTPFLPDGLSSASFANTNISAVNNLPLSMSALNISTTLVTTTSMDIPSSMSYLDVSYAVFGNTALENVTTNLVSNGQLSGTFRMLGYGPPSTATLINNILALSLNSWTLDYDV